MAITVEIDGDGVRIVDTAAGRPIWGPSLVSSLSVTEVSQGKTVYATGVSAQALAFGGVSAAKVVAVKASGKITLKLNGESTGHDGTLFLFVDSAGGFTAATVGQSTGSDVTVDFLIAG